jgi:hypothetical protein
MAALVPGTCPTCGQRDLHRHCERSVYCTWSECRTCWTLLDQRSGKFVARAVREKGSD